MRGCSAYAAKDLFSVTVAITHVLFWACGSAHGADAPTTVGPPTIVTSTRLNETAAGFPVGTRIITARDIERSGTTTLQDLLRSSPGLRTLDRSGSPNPQIDLRGFGIFGDQNTLVLLDGLRARDYEQLTVNWSAIPLESVERIEILPPGASVLYGGGATGGVINIVTRAPKADSRSASVGGTVGSYQTGEARVGAEVAGASQGLRAHGSHYQSDNYRDNNRVRINNAQGDIRWTGDASSLAVKLGGDDQYTGLPSVISEAQIAADRRRAGTPNDFATQQGGYVNVVAQGKAWFGDLLLNVGYRERDILQNFLVGTPRRNNVDTQLEVWTIAPRLSLKPGLGGREDSLVLGADFDDWTFDAVSGPTIPGRPHSTQRGEAIYAQYTTSFATRTTLALGARGQHARYGVVDSANPAAAGSRGESLHAWDISARQGLARGAAVFGMIGSSFKVPNVNDNYNPFLARVTLLNPQTAHDAQLGLEGEAGPVHYRVAAYRVDLRDEIFFDPVTLGSRNRQPTRRQGLELAAQWQPAAPLELYARYLYADATFREGVSRGGVPIAGNRVPLVPRHSLYAGARWSLAGGARADFDLRSFDESVFDADEANTFGRRIPGYTVADLRLRVQSGNWRFNAGVLNLFDRKYLDYGVVTGLPTYAGIPAPERTAFVSAQFSFR